MKIKVGGPRIRGAGELGIGVECKLPSVSWYRVFLKICLETFNGMLIYPCV